MPRCLASFLASSTKNDSHCPPSPGCVFLIRVALCHTVTSQACCLHTHLSLPPPSGCYRRCHSSVGDELTKHEADQHCLATVKIAQWPTGAWRTSSLGHVGTEKLQLKWEYKQTKLVPKHHDSCCLILKGIILFASCLPTLPSISLRLEGSDKGE